MSYQGKRIPSFKIVSLDILILKKKQFSGDQNYLKVAIKVTSINDMNIKILCFIHAFPHTFFVPKQRNCQRNNSLFIYDNHSNFVQTWGNFDQPIKVIPSAIKVTPLDGVTLISLWFRISSFKNFQNRLVTLFHGKPFGPNWPKTNF